MTNTWPWIQRLAVLEGGLTANSLGCPTSTTNVTCSKTQLEFLSHLIFPQTFPSQSMTTRIFHLLRPPTLFIIIPDSPVSLIGLHSQNSSKSCQPPESQSDYSHPLGGPPPPRRASSPPTPPQPEALLSITTLFRSLLTSLPASRHDLSHYTAARVFLLFKIRWVFFKVLQWLPFWLKAHTRVFIQGRLALPDLSQLRPQTGPSIHSSHTSSLHPVLRRPRGSYTSRLCRLLSRLLF